MTPLSHIQAQLHPSTPSKKTLEPRLAKGNHPSKFQLAGIRRFGGIREQTNGLTHWQTVAWLYIVFLRNVDRSSKTTWQVRGQEERRTSVNSVETTHHTLERLCPPPEKNLSSIFCFFIDLGFRPKKQPFLKDIFRDISNIFCHKLFCSSAKFCLNNIMLLNAMAKSLS